MVERNFDEAGDLLDQSIDLHRRRQAERVPPWLLSARAEVATAQRDFVAAGALLQELAADARRFTNPAILAGAVARLGLVAFAEEHADEAVRCAAEVLASPKVSESTWLLAMLGETLAGVAVARGDAHAAARLLGASDSLRRDFPPPREQPQLPFEHDATLASAGAALGDEAFSGAWAAGVALDRDGLVTLLAEVVAALSPPPPPPPPNW